MPAEVSDNRVEFFDAFTQGYEEVSQKFTSIRRVRGDNYCALRATLFQAMSQPAALPPWLQDPELTLVRSCCRFESAVSSRFSEKDFSFLPVLCAGAVCSVTSPPCGFVGFCVAGVVLHSKVTENSWYSQKRK